MITSVRVRVVTGIGTLLALVGYAAYDLRSTDVERRELSDQSEMSSTMEIAAWRLANLKSDATSLKEFHDTMEKLEPEERRGAWRRFHAAIENREAASIIKQRLEFGAKFEDEFRRVNRNRISYLEERVTYTSSSLLLALVLGLVFIPTYLRWSIFSPLNSLTKRMTDFLYDRYTYQFEVPSPTEIGQLQSTFNSLAQHVLRNMEELMSLDHAKSEFLSIASHELRTPLTSIKGSLSLLQSGVTGPLNDMANNLIHIAEAETDRLIRLINELLDLAKIEAGKFEVRPEWHPLSLLVDRTFSSLAGLAQAAQVKLEASHLPPVKLNIDLDRMQQVLTNLLSNAIKFSPAHEAVNVSIEIDDQQMLWVKVSDHGKGIAPEDQELIFQKFRQATSAKNPLVKGTGLGLAIAKALVEEHGGQIMVRSTPGQGSTFMFSLPNWKYDRDQVANNQTMTGAAA